MKQEFIEKLIKMANRECFYDCEDEDVVVDDYAGGNVDDAFAIGERAGETILAREMLIEMGIKWTK